MIIEAVRERERAAARNALDAVATAARAVAAGKAADPDAVAALLAAAGQTAADFEAAVALAKTRAEWLASVDRLPGARAKVTKAQAALAIEQTKFIEARDAFAQKGGALEDEINAAQAIINEGDRAREQLLDPRNVPGGLGQRWNDAVSAAHAAAVAVGEAERTLRDLDDAIKNAAGWIKQMAKQEPEEVDPSTWKANADQAEWGRDQHGGELEAKLRHWNRLKREREEAAAALAAASKTLAAAKKAREAMAQEVIKA